MSLSFRILVPLLGSIGGLVLAGCASEPERGWTQEDGYRWRAVELEAFFEQMGFVQLDSSQTGVSFRNTLAQASIERNRHYTNGSGVAIGDVNGDEWPDLYFGWVNSTNRVYFKRKHRGRLFS